MTRTLLTPAEANRALEETSAAWSSLRNAAFGRGAIPPEVPAAALPVRAQIEVQNEAFRAWRDRLSAIDSVNMSWGSELAEWREQYEALASAWASSTGQTVVQLSKVQGLGEATDTALGRIGISGAYLALGAFGLYLLMKRKG